MQPILVLCGPTATGKTALAVSLAKKMNGELISADSRQVYIGMDIGTGKDKDTIDVPIHCIDVVNPDEDFSVSQFVRLAKSAITEIRGRGKLPIVVGGTGLYISSLLAPPGTLSIPPDKSLRSELSGKTVPQLQALVPEGVLSGMNNSDRYNPRRLIRKIEIGQSVPPPNDTHSVYTAFIVGLRATKEQLRDRISKRVRERMEKGMSQEVDRLVNTYGNGIPALTALGYRSPDTWASDELRYARRQMTWFKKMQGIRWYDCTDPHTPERVARDVAKWYTNITK